MQWKITTGSDRATANAQSYTGTEGRPVFVDVTHPGTGPDAVVEIIDVATQSVLASVSCGFTDQGPKRIEFTPVADGARTYNLVVSPIGADFGAGIVINANDTSSEEVPYIYTPSTQATAFPGAVVAPNISRITKWEKKERTNPFGSATEFPKFDAAFQNFIKGSSDLVISFQGASHVDGIGSEGNGSNNLRPNRAAWPKFFGERLRELLGARIGVFSTPTDFHWGEWTLGSGWNTSYYLGGVAQGRVVYNNTNSNPLTFYAPDIEVEWDAVDVYYVKKSSAGNFGITATGGTTVNTNGNQASGNTIAKATCYAAAPSKNNTLTVTRTDGSCLIVGATFYRKDFNKLVLMNCAVGGTTSGNWNDSTGTTLFGDEVARVAGATMTMMSVGVNDQGSSVPVATYQSNYQAIVTRVAAYSDFIALPPFHVGVTDTGAVKTDLDAYRDAIRDGVTGYRKFIDVRTKMQELSIPYANFSNQHPSAQGYRMIADLIWREMIG